MCGTAGKRVLVFVVALLPLAVGVAEADVRLPHVIGSHMVLQCGRPLSIWGWADPGEEVTVALGENNRSSTRASERGEWQVRLGVMKAGGPHTMTVKGDNIITLDDVLVGEVWLGSGQSNMQWGVAGSANAAQEIAAADYPQIRLFLVPNVLSGVPSRDVNAAWQKCSPQTVPGFSAVLYYFGRYLHKDLGVPVGLIASAWGGSLIEPWTPPMGFAAEEELAHITAQIRQSHKSFLDQVEAQVKDAGVDRADVRAWLESARAAVAEDRLVPPAPDITLPAHPLAGWASPTSMYNAMINPVVPFALRGAIWYQGESNMVEGMLYYYKMRALIHGWRTVWGQDALPFYWAQLAPFNYGSDPLRLPAFWEAQTAAMSIPHTGMAVLNDIGNPRNIHPGNKQDVGKRLALWALAKDYGKDMVYSGPQFKSMKIDGEKIRVVFSHVGEGLESRDGKELTWFEIGDQERFVAAKAEILPPAEQGKAADTVLVWSDEIRSPAAVRFGWHQLAAPDLQNSAGLPAGAFRTTCEPPTISGKVLFLDSTRVELKCLTPNVVIRYTLDGSTPTEESPRYGEPLLLNSSASVKARAFSPDGRKSMVTCTDFEKAAPRQHEGKTLGPGLRYEYYEGEMGTKLPDFDALKPASTGVTDEFSLGMCKRLEGIGLRFTGYLDVRKEGDYTFHLASDDGSRLYVDDKVVVDNDGVHPMMTRRGTVHLEKGLHAIKLIFFEAAGEEGLSLQYQGPGVALQAVPTWCEQ